MGDNRKPHFSVGDVEKVVDGFFNNLLVARVGDAAQCPQHGRVCRQQFRRINLRWMTPAQPLAQQRLRLPAPLFYKKEIDTDASVRIVVIEMQQFARRARNDT